MQSIILTTGILLLISTQSTLSSPVPVEEIDALWALYNDTHGDEWLWRNESYGARWHFNTILTEINPCNDNHTVWQGIQCSNPPENCTDDSNTTCHIVELYLDDYELAGSLPYEIGNLSQLTYLRLVNNFELVGTLPHSIMKLQLLETLDLETSKLSGAIPSLVFELPNLKQLRLVEGIFSAIEDSDLCSGTKLTHLDLSYNHIYGTIPECILRLSNLDYISFRSNRLSGPCDIGDWGRMQTLNYRGNYLNCTFPTNVLLLHDLTYLDLSVNSIHGTLPPNIGSLSRLEFLALEEVGIRGSLPLSLGNLVEVSELRLTNNALTGNLFSLRNLSQIQNLELDGNLFTGHIPDSIYEFNHLCRLYLSTNLLSGTVSSMISNLKLVERLYFYDNALTGKLPDGLSMLTSLEYMDISDNYFTNSLPVDFGMMTALKSVSLSSNFFSSSLPSSIGNLTNLVSLYGDQNWLTGSLPESIYNLVPLAKMMFNINYLSGSLCGDIGRLTRVNYVDLTDNAITGPIPSSIANMSSLRYFVLRNNRITSTLPLSLTTMTFLQNLELTSNMISGPLPAYIGVSLRYLYVGDNYLTGSIPSSLFPDMSSLIHLQLTDNYLTSTIPTSISSLSNLIYLYLGGNKFTGKLEEGITELYRLQDVVLDTNSLSGSVPASLSQLTLLNFLQLHHNNFEGTLPSSLSNLQQLRVLQVNNNEISGHVSHIFDSPLFKNLVNVDMSTNRFSGMVPQDLFMIPSIQTIALSSNCFEGTLPLSMCNASQLSVISMDGLRAARDCPRTFRLPFSGALISLSTHTAGTLPSCLWELPNLKVLHVAANLLTGNLKVDRITPTLLNVSLAHNHLEGTIPDAVDKHYFQTLDLSNNKITGVASNRYYPDVVKNDSDSVFMTKLTLIVNRLSGGVPRGLSYARRINILTGNLFGCDDLPSHDPHRSEYNCGSIEMDESLYVLLAAVVAIAVIGGTPYLFWLRRRGEASGISDSDILEADKDNNISLPALYRLVQLSLSQAKLLPWDVMPYLKAFLCMLDAFQYYTILIASCGVVFCLPLYVLKIIADESEGVGIVTHTHTYRWILTAGFITGPIPATMLLVAWSVGATILVLGLRQSVCNSQRKVKIEHTSSSYENELNSSTVVRSRYNYPRVAALVIFNTIIVGTVNALYVYSSTIYITSAIRLTIQFALAIFKLFWNFAIVPSIVLPFIDSPRQRARLKVLILLMNSIIAPLFVLAVSGPSCFRDLFFLPPTLSSSYSYEECVAFSLSSVTVCDEFETVVSTTDPFHPPFNYNNLCTSNVITAYVPVYIYTYSFLLLLPCVLLVIYKYARWSDLPVWIVKYTPMILWPFRLSSSGEYVHTSDCEDHMLEAHLTKLKLLTSHFLRSDMVVSSFAHHLAVLLSFGLLSPVLTIEIAAALCLSTFQWRFFIGRFLLHRSHSHGVSVSAGDREAPHHIANPLHDRSVILRDESLKKLNFAVEEAASSFVSCVGPVMCVTSMFICSLCWDIVSDRRGWQVGIYVPVFSFGTLAILFTLVYLRFKPTTAFLDFTTGDGKTDGVFELELRQSNWNQQDVSNPIL